MQSRTFSGFSIVRSMHEKGFYEMRLTMEFSAGVKKIKTFLKKLLFFFKKAVIFFWKFLIFLKNVLVFWGEIPDPTRKLPPQSFAKLLPLLPSSFVNTHEQGVSKVVVAAWKNICYHHFLSVITSLSSDSLGIPVTFCLSFVTPWNRHIRLKAVGCM